MQGKCIKQSLRLARTWQLINFTSLAGAGLCSSVLSVTYELKLEIRYTVCSGLTYAVFEVSTFFKILLVATDARKQGPKMTER